MQSLGLVLKAHMGGSQPSFSTHNHHNSSPRDPTHQTRTWYAYIHASKVVCLCLPSDATSMCKEFSDRAISLVPNITFSNTIKVWFVFLAELWGVPSILHYLALVLPASLSSVASLVYASLPTSTSEPPPFCSECTQHPIPAVLLE